VTETDATKLSKTATLPEGELASFPGESLQGAEENVMTGARALTVLLVSALSASSAAQQALPVPREVIVSVPRAVDRPGVEAFVARGGGRVVDELPALGLLLVAVPEGISAEAAATRLASVPGVRHADVNGWGRGGDFPVNDTFFADLWHLDNRGQSGGTPGADIEALRAWELTRGSPAVRVAVLDSGIGMNHPEFAGRILPGFDFWNNDDNPQDDHGHGTMVSSLLAANADNAFGVAGVDHQCLLIPVKVLNQFNGGSTFALAQGLVFAADAGADVISMSLINYPSSPSLREALQYARDAGCVLVACGGNGGIGDADQTFPGRSPLVIEVGATTAFDERAWFSGTGERLDVVAPGDLVPAMTYSPAEQLVLFSGCSAATPVVSGIVALLLSVDPTLTHDEVQALLQDNADDQVGPAEFDLPGRDDHYGYGRVNAFRSLCGLDDNVPILVAPDVIHVDGAPGSVLSATDPLVMQAFASVRAFDDLDPHPTIGFRMPGTFTYGRAASVSIVARDACGNEVMKSVEVVVNPPAPSRVGKVTSR